MTPFVVPWSKHIPGRQVRTSLVFIFISTLISKQKVEIADESSKIPFSIIKQKKVLCFQTMTSLDWFSSIWPPHCFIHAASRVEDSRGVTVAPVAIHPSLRLAGQVGVHQGGARGGASARRDHPGGRTVPAGNHGELVRAGRGAVVKIGRAAGLEGSTLALGGARVWRGKVGVVVGAAQRHAGGDWRRVGEGGRVVHPRAGETALCEGGEARELTIELTGERAQIRRTYGHTHETFL